MFWLWVPTSGYSPCGLFSRVANAKDIKKSIKTPFVDFHSVTKSLWRSNMHHKLYSLRRVCVALLRRCYTSRWNQEIHIFISIIGSGVQIRSVWGTPWGSWHAESGAVIGVIYALIQSAWPQGYPFKSPLKPPSSLLCLRMPQLLLLFFFLLPTLLFFRMICLPTNPLGN